ncbi:cytochrome c biogenesis CcdA family protein [Paenisporosarcina sp. TG20]|uniref:cytochrome c biogenesis CcdA family protein n=1 Tax=Paenisporosarcina sp. TG20 TaxID=1211706 RepID=UPI00030BED9C|nr:cytochrome c biogenesis protein CcdA [Paenisporosarcina sp. TG20]
MNFIYEGLAGVETISPIVYLLVLLGGIASALSICYVPILIMFSSYISGRIQEETGKAFRISIGFTLGMIITSVLVGIVAALVGKPIMQIFTSYGLAVWIPAIIGIIMGLQLLEIIKITMPPQIQIKAKKPETVYGAFTLGLPFGLVITPCTIPIFIMIVTYVIVNGSVLHGALLLGTYSLGKGIVLALVAVSSVSLLKDVTKTWSKRIEKIAGIVIILMSFYILIFGW